MKADDGSDVTGVFNALGVGVYVAEDGSPVFAAEDDVAAIVVDGDASDGRGGAVDFLLLSLS